MNPEQNPESECEFGFSDSESCFPGFAFCDSESTLWLIRIPICLSILHHEPKAFLPVK